MIIRLLSKFIGIWELKVSLSIHSQCSKMRSTLLLILFLSLSQAIAQPFKVVGYFPHYRFSWVNDIDYQKLTHVNIAFANPDANGNLSCEGANIDPIVEKCHQNGCKVFISLAGGYLTPAWESAWNDLTLAANRPGYIQKIVQYVQSHNLDGVDLDLEWQYVKSWYSPFVLDLKTALDQIGVPLTVALPGSYRYPQITNEALAAFDWVNMMIYDLRGPWDPSNIGQHSPYSWAVDCIQYWKNQNVPADKLTLGVPFYGYDFGTSPVSSFTFRGIVNQDAANAYKDDTGLKFWNGIPTIKEKTALALSEVNGIMIWEIGQDAFGANAQYSLLNAIDEVIQGTLATGEPDLVVSIFPNPVSDQLHIKSDQISLERIVLQDIQGKIFLDEKVHSSGLHNCDIATVPTGMYILSIFTNKGSLTKKLLKQ